MQYYASRGAYRNPDALVNIVDMQIAQKALVGVASSVQHQRTSRASHGGKSARRRTVANTWRRGPRVRGRVKLVEVILAGMLIPPAEEIDLPLCGAHGVGGPRRGAAPKRCRLAQHLLYSV